jgi:hypothetical protein
MVATGTKGPLERQLRYVIIALALLLLAEVVILSLQPGAGYVASDGGSGFGADGAPTEVASLPTLDNFQESVDRSLFAWNRQPITPGQKPGEEQGPDFSGWQLSGIVSYPGRSSLAIFVDQESGESLVLEEEMYLGERKIHSIAEETVILLDGEKEQVMQLQALDIELSEEEIARRAAAEVSEKAAKPTIKRPGGEKKRDEKEQGEEAQDDKKLLLERLLENESNK